MGLQKSQTKLGDFTSSSSLCLLPHGKPFLRWTENTVICECIHVHIPKVLRLLVKTLSSDNKNDFRCRRRPL